MPVRFCSRTASAPSAAASLRGCKRRIAARRRSIGDDPVAIARLHPGLDIWGAYAVIHLLMPDGSMKPGGSAVAQVLRALPNTTWLASILDLHVAGFRPGALLVDIGYADLRWLTQWWRTGRIAAVPHHASALRVARGRATTP